MGVWAEWWWWCARPGRLPRAAPLSILLATVLTLISLLFFLNAKALNRHPSPRHLLDLEDHDMEGAPQHHPELITYIRQLHLLPPAPGPYQLQQPNASDFSQNGQSRRVASILGGKRGGVFLEAGAYDGEALSNTLYLERELGWRGLLVEPDPWNFWALRKRGRKAHAIQACLSPNPFPKEVTFSAWNTEGLVRRKVYLHAHRYLHSVVCLLAARNYHHLSKFPCIYLQASNMEVTIDESFTRTSPISSAEKQMLIGLITQEPILKNRKTDGKLLEQKRRAWARITQHFNAHNMGPKRTEGQLRKIWEKIRVKANQEDARQKREIFRTGGGTPPKVLTPETEQVLSILGTNIQDIGNPYDHDAMSSQATSHRHGRLIRFTKSLFVRENSYSTALYEVVHLEEPAAPPLPTPAEEPTLEERNSVAEPEVSSCPSSSGKRRQHSARRALQDHELYGTPGGESASNKKEEMQRRFLEKRDALMDLQMQHMQVRLEEAKQRREEAKESWEEAKERREEAKERREEAKERREEARLYKEIARQKLLELRNKQ